MEQPWRFVSWDEVRELKLHGVCGKPLLPADRFWKEPSVLQGRCDWETPCGSGETEMLEGSRGEADSQSDCRA